MTRPAPWRRTTVREREEQSREFQRIKAAVDASPEMEAYREANRLGAARRIVRLKLRRAAAGDRTVKRLTAIQAAAMTADQQWILTSVLTPEQRFWLWPPKSA